VGVEIKAHMRSVGSKHSLRSWVGRKKFPLEDYFRVIDDYLDSIQTRLGMALECTAAVQVVAGTLDQEGALFKYIDNDREYVIESDEDWERICTAAAWIVIEKYDEAVTAGKWPVNDDG
jgi:hypothetical protein